MRHRSAWFVALLLLPMIAQAQSGPRPEESPITRRRFGPGGFGGNFGPGASTRPYAQRPGDDGGGQRPQEQRSFYMPTDEEWAKASEFFRVELPNSWALFERFPDMSRGKYQARSRMYARYQELTQAPEDLRPLKLDQAKIGDEILGLTSKYREANDDTERASIKAELRTKLQRKLEVELAERTKRIEHLTQQLDKERKKLAVDQKTLDSKLDERVDALLNYRPNEGDRPSDRPGDRPLRDGPPDQTLAAPVQR